MTLTTIRWLSIFTGALSLFYLGHAWFEFGLGEVFTLVYAWYSGILHPVVELLRPVALWVVGFFGWSLPVWWKDGLMLYLAMGGAMVRHVDAVGRRGFVLYRSNLEAVGIIFGVLLWPVLWIINLVRAISGPESLLGGYFGGSLFEFSKILLGALIFAGLNAGLG